ncbi:MAG TPA: hypothetical protein VH349_18680 [Ktedonobacterales bacterium]|jgi:hypothetical protein
MLDDIATWAFWIGILLWQVAAIVSLWLWGGVKRSALGHLAAGILALVSGTLFIHVTIINVFARMDNAYLGNGILGGYFIFAGATLLLGALAGYGVYVWVVVLLWLGAAAFAYFGIPWLTNIVPFPDSGLLLFTMVLLIGVLSAVMVRGYAVEIAVSVMLALAGIALVWWIYGAGFRAFTPVETLEGSSYKPPALDLWPFLACLIAVTALFFAGRFIQGRLRGPRAVILASRMPAPN